MAKNRIYKFASIAEAEHFLNGGLVFGPIPVLKPNELKNGWNVVGKTLKFTSPSSVTVTFTAGAAPDATRLTFAELKAQVEAAIAAVKVIQLGGRLAFIEANPSSGVAFDKTGTANALLGIDTAVNTAAVVYKAPHSSADPIDPPFWSAVFSVSENTHVVYTWE